MKKQLLFYVIISVLIQTIFITNSFSASFIWIGTNSSSWLVSGNWSGGGSGATPGSGDNITINSNAPNNLVLDQNRTVTNFTINGDTLDLGTYTLTTTGVTYFNGGLLNNGNLNISGSLCHFGGATINARTEANCGYYHMNGGSFLRPVILVSTGSANTSGTGNCIFSDSLSITHGGSYYFTTGSTYGDNFQNVTITNNSTREIYLGTADTTFISGNLILNNTSTGGFVTGNTGGVTYLASGKTISIGSSGFTNNYLTLKNFYQQGATSQTLTLTGTAILNLINANFDGNFTVTSPGILLKNSTFNGATSITRNGSSGNYHCDGGNNFIGAFSLDNAGSVGRVRFANTIPDNFYGDATFNSTGGQDVQIAYSGNNVVSGNLTLNSNKVVFNTGSGKVTFSGGNSQILNGSNTFQFKKVAINKNSGFVTVNTLGSVDDTLFLIKGTFLTKATNLINLKLGAKVTGASDSSFIDGPVKKTGNTAFVFPTGANNSYRPIEITAPATTTSEFTAEFMEDSVMVNTDNRDATLSYLFRNKYWALERNSGSSNVYVTLSWSASNAVVDTFISVSSWNGSQWKDLGHGTISGDSATGTIKSNTTAAYYNEFTIGYLNINTLPNIPNCSSVQNPAFLRFCLVHTSSGTVSVTAPITINNSAALGPGFFPIPIHSGVILEGLVGGFATKWWEPNCPLITADHKAKYEVDNPAFPIINLYLFSIQPGATIQNLRIRGANLDHKDFNDPDFLCGGIYVQGIGNTAANILNCEIFGFSQAGIWKNYDTDLLNIDNCYIHKVKGRSKYGIGYGAWLMSEQSPIAQVVNITNTIFDDCKAAIDGQAHIVNWNINKCTLSQFFQSEDINSHNDNRFEIEDCPCSGITPDYDNNYDYNPILLNSSLNFYGTYWDANVNCVNTVCTVTSQPGHAFGLLTSGFSSMTYYPNLIGIPIHDVGGSVTSIQNTVFHKKRSIGANGNINLSYPNLDNARDGAGSNNVNISKNTFATDKFDKDVVLTTKENNAGYAKIANNYIEADIWSIDGAHIIKNYNSFSYQSGSLVTTNAPQPHELALELKAGTTALPTSYSLSPLEGHKYIQYVDVNTAFNLEASLTNAGSSAESYYIIRPNPNTNGVSTTSEAHVISNENYFFDSEERLNGTTISKSFTYNKPGLYGIDVMGFDAHDYGTAEYDFRASSWQHIPVIVKGTQEQMLYFNIKDSYHIATPNPTGVKKQAYLNKLLIWEEDIAVGGDGWELVEIDLTGFAFNGTTNILDSIHTDGTENILSFSIYMEYPTLNSPPFSGVQVYVDDIYIPKTGSITGDNLVKDGSVELSKENLCSECYWFQNLADQSTGGCGNTAASINSIERKSGNQSLYLEIPFEVKGCTFTNSINKVVASLGTYIDFTDLLSCDDYWNGTSSNVGFELYPPTGVTTPYIKRKFYIQNPITIGSSETLTFTGCDLVFAPGVEITVDDGGELTINLASTIPITPSHLFSCDEMWQGITVNPGGVFNFNGSLSGNDDNLCKIENAEVAVNAIGNGSGSLNPSIYLNHVTFNNNLISTKLTDDNYGSTFLRSCKYECESAYLTKAPHQGVYPQNHILLEDVTEVTIGGSGNVPNTFTDIYSGIKMVRSNAYVLSSHFKDLKNNNVGPSQNGIGIITENLTNVPCTLEVGAATQFKNLHRGIFSRGNFNIDIHNVVYFRDIDDISIALFHSNYNNKVVIDNVEDFSRTNIGVLVSGRNLYSFIVSNNEFINTDFVETSTGSFQNTAITLRGFSSTSGAVEVFNNNLTDYRIGIHAINLNNLKIGGYDINNNNPVPNYIYFNVNNGTNLTNPHTGIWLQNCDNAIVKINEILNDEKVSSNSDLLRGIATDNSENLNICGNNIYKMGFAMRFEGNCINSRLKNNLMKDYFEGIHFADAQFTKQGTGTNDAWDNKWERTDVTEYPNFMKVEGTFDPPGQIDWYYQGSTANTNLYNPDPFNSQLLSPIGANSGAHNCLTASVSDDDIDRDLVYGPVVGDSAIYDTNPDEAAYLAKEALFKRLKANPDLLTIGSSADSSFNAFYQSMLSTNIGKFDSVRSSLSENDLEAADDINSVITEDNTIEENNKIIYDLIINTVSTGDTLSSSDTTLLESIFEQDWRTAGKGVYQAAGILGKEYYTTSTYSRVMEQLQPIKKDSVVKSTFEIKMHPNPSSSKLFFTPTPPNDSVIKIFDSTGRTILSKPFSQEINISGIEEGFYIVKIFTNNELLFNETLIKIK